MALLKVHSKRVIDNIVRLTEYLHSKDITWTLVTKLLSGNRKVLEALLHHEALTKLHSIGDSRLSNLKAIKDINPDLTTMYIKPSPPTQAEKVIRYADISFNTSEETLNALNDEAARQNKIHRVVIMLEMGELREGVIRDKIISFYQRIFDLSNIHIIGLGTNLGCMHGIEPTYDKMIQLSLYKLLLEEKFQRKLEIVSAGSSITLSLVKQNKIPSGVNHFRIGETAFFGVSLLDDYKRFRNLHTNAFEFQAEILELEKKKYLPDGNQSEAGIGVLADVKNLADDLSGESYRAIVDFGELDVDTENLKPKLNDVKFFGTTSDMTVFDLGSLKKHHKVGGRLHFIPNYMAVARLMGSKYIEKVIV